MQSLHQRRRRRSTRIALFVPLAAICLGSTAWAAATQRLPQWWRTVVELTSSAPSPPPASTPKKAQRTRPKTQPEPQPGAVVDPAAAVLQPAPAVAQSALGALPAPPLEPRARIEPASTPRRDTPPPSDPGSPASKPDPTDALYRTAHELHFGARDPARALQAWDVYLAAAPNGRWAIEARYNRALALLRLGRSVEARAALEPFARGAYGDYRRAEAQALIGAVDGGADPSFER